MIKRIKIEKGERWWGGSTSSNVDKIPFTSGDDYSLDLLRASNQIMPLYISGNGRYIWSEKPFKISVSGDEIIIESDYDIILDESGKTLKDAYLNAMKKHFPFTGKTPNLTFFVTAQYNTWMEFDYNPTQEGVLDYARKIIENGYQPGVLMIDEGWHTRYGFWEWDKAKFPNPKAMIDELHLLGFKVMLWIVPYMTTDGRDFCFFKEDGNAHPEKKRMLRNEDGIMSIIRWWNGYSAVYDMTNKADREFLDGILKGLMRDYGVDGFKFDGGMMTSFVPENVINGVQSKRSPDELNEAWNEFGLKYEFHEYKDTFKGGGKPSIQRLCDRDHRWNDNGIDSIIPSALLQGLIGHPFICPDMIGGGEYHYNYMPNFKIDEELFVRMAQVSALFPMMQFSWAPWRVLSEKGRQLCFAAAKLHAKYSDYIVENVKKSAVSGEPIIRHLEYSYPHCGYEKINDEFMLGDKMLVAPVIKKGETKRTVVLPEGKWLYLGKEEFVGGKKIEVDAPIEILPYFVLKGE